MHKQVGAGCDNKSKDERLWEVQRILTQLKRMKKNIDKKRSHQKLNNLTLERKKKHGSPSIKKQQSPMIKKVEKKKVEVNDEVDKGEVEQVVGNDQSVEMEDISNGWSLE